MSGKLSQVKSSKLNEGGPLGLLESAETSKNYVSFTVSFGTSAAQFPNYVYLENRGCKYSVNTAPLFQIRVIPEP